MRWAHAFAFAALAGAGIGLLWQPEPVESTREQDDAWGMPSRSELARYDASDFAVVRKAVQWSGQETGLQAAARPEKSWRLAGISRDPEPVALIQINASKQLLRVAAGAELPDGTRLEQIGSDRVTVVTGECRRTLYLYRQSPPADPSGCDGTADESN